jgi:hypothetical protein
MDETLAVANADLDVRGFSKEEYLGLVEVRAICLHSEIILSQLLIVTLTAS